VSEQCIRRIIGPYLEKREGEREQVAGDSIYIE